MQVGWIRRNHPKRILAYCAKTRSPGHHGNRGFFILRACQENPGQPTRREVPCWLAENYSRFLMFQEEARHLEDYLGIVSRGAVSLLVAPSPCALLLTPVPPWSSEFGLGN